jgi:hypothetical protein
MVGGSPIQEEDIEPGRVGTVHPFILIELFLVGTAHPTRLGIYNIFKRIAIACYRKNSSAID